MLGHPLARVALMGGAALAFLAAAPAAALAQNVTDRAAAGGAVDNESLLSEPRFISLGLDAAKQVFGNQEGPPNSGFYPEFSNMIVGSGFISIGPGYRHNFRNGKTFFDTSTAVSWHLYKMAQARLEAEVGRRRITIGAQGMWQDHTQVSYFGRGPDRQLEDQAQYRLQTLDLVGYMEGHPKTWLTIGGELGWLKRPRILPTSGTFNPNYPDARVVYAADSGMTDSYQPNFLHSELAIMARTVDSRSHPTSGGLYRAAIAIYSDESSGAYTFNQYEVEAMQMIPLGERRFVLGLHGWTVHSEVPNGHDVPVYLMPALGGNDTIRSFDDFQFHDRNTIVGTAELRVMLLAHLDAAAFVDAGSVAARYADLNFAKTAVGGGLRLHMNRSTLGRIDVAHGTQGWTLVLRTSDPFRYSRITSRIAGMPFRP